MKKNFFGLFKNINLQITWKWFALSLVLGAMTGFAAVVFQIMLEAVLGINWSLLIGFKPSGSGGEHAIIEMAVTHGFLPWLLVIVPTVGGLISGFIVYTWAPEAEGHGTDSAIEAYHIKNGFIKYRVPFIKTVASAITIGTGGSGGREGPIALIGAGFGSMLARIFHLSARERKMLLVSGIGAGIGGIFRAPIAGALFAIEVLYSDTDVEVETMIPATLSSIISYCVVGSFFGFGHLFITSSAVTFSNPLELIPYFILAIIVAFGAMFYSGTFYYVQRKFRELKIPDTVKPAIGGAMTGGLALILYLIMQDTDVLGIMGTGYGFLQKLFTVNSFTSSKMIILLAIIAFGKLLTTSFSISSGGSAGVFGPSMVIGGALGGLVGVLFNLLFPGMVIHPTAFVLIGMAGFFSAAANTPLSTLIMVSELTGNYKLLIPTMWVCTFSYLFGRKYGIYSKQVPNRLQSPAHKDEFFIDLLEEVKVRDVLKTTRKIILIHYKMHLKDIMDMVVNTHQKFFPVIDDHGELYGIFTMTDLRALLDDKEIEHLVIAEDLCETDLITVTPDDNLRHALKAMLRKNLEEIPVVASNNPKQFKGMLTRGSIMGEYNKKVITIKTNKNYAQDQVHL